MPVELPQRLLSSRLELSLIIGQRRQQTLANRVVGFGKLRHPFRHHLVVAQVAQATEERLGQAFHLLPRGIRIHGEETVSHGTAAANRHAQVVYRIGSKALAGLIAFFHDAVRPMGEARLLLLGMGAWQHGKETY